MGDIRRGHERPVEEDLLCFHRGNFVTIPQLGSIPAIPLEAFALEQSGQQIIGHGFRIR